MTKLLKILIVVVIIIGLAIFAKTEYSNYQNKPSQTSSSHTAYIANNQTLKPAVATVNPCLSNTLNQLVLVSVSKRHLWACSYQNILFNSPVVTGMEFLAADLTPVGTYHIYAKQTDRYLTGQDSTGSWNVYVYYWMPFLYNQYGAYGFHDATWRQPNAFGNVSQYSSNASHGCVELPLATAQWLYGWVQVGTTVKVIS
jgi:lipoprotein-anchoring transpeptidase ErfK/SrfK